MSEGRRHIGNLGAPAAAETSGISLVRRAFEAFGQCDLPALFELTDGDVELFAPTAALANEVRCYRGHGGIARYLHDVQRSWESFEVIPERFREVGNHVVSLGRVHARAHDGLEVDDPAAWVWEIRGAKLCWGCVYANPGEPFMGLSRDSGATPTAPAPFPSGAPPSARVA
jgi:ketosteroid isomerase-like protein